MGFPRKKILDADIAAMEAEDMEVFEEYYNAVMANLDSHLRSKVNAAHIEIEFLNSTPVIDCVSKLKDQYFNH